MMTTEQVVQWGMGIATLIFGGGGLAALIGVFVTRKLGIKTSENEANKVINVTWEAIVDDLQGQIVAGREEFTKQITLLRGEFGKLQERVERQDAELASERRLVLKAIGHINKLEPFVPIEHRIPRPEGLE